MNNTDRNTDKATAIPTSMEYGIETFDSDNNFSATMKTYSVETFKRITTAWKRLKNVGYSKCANNLYMQRGNQYAHYIKRCRKIVFETNKKEK